MDLVSTATIPHGERLAFWREVSSRTWVPYDLRCEPYLRSRFRARIEAAELGPVRAALMTATPHSVQRTPRLIRQADPELFKLTCLVRGRAMLEQEGRRADYGVGDLVLHNTSHPYSAGLAPQEGVSRMLVLQFPRSLLPLPPRDLRNLTAVRIPGDAGVGALSSRFLLHLARHLGEFSPADAARLSTLTLDLLAAALAHELDVIAAVPPCARRRALLARVHAFILRNLGDPRLSPGAIAAAHHISLRHLHQLFREEGHTVAGWIREQRLRRCRRDLADPRLAAHSISALAARWAFTSPAHFSQAFRAAYGVPPSQFRRQCATRRAA
ncbi:helix-turn-helix domain-containing protein [Bailinhaonella thermotolerans]|uniref:Helix-turn-helix domain-containing protein n=1 Tax=Bailinhaonella thermotolerans TaxID=1070861 RepID=A0A3A4B1D6_9ACTN|nr:helix-turn-helix domain-containing protein [Bailinhaonella thermotolerans]RJL35545.1 helix-turn-helix domain-containing protein [Bailinhaonella thermotolerans]